MQVMWDCLDIKNMGVGSLTSHMKYKKHQLKESGMSTATVSFFAATSVPGTSSTNWFVLVKLPLQCEGDELPPL